MTDSDHKPSQAALEFAKEYTRERWIRTFGGAEDNAQLLLAQLFDRAIQQAVQEEREACEREATRVRAEAQEFVNSDVMAGAWWACDEIEAAIRSRGRK